MRKWHLAALGFVGVLQADLSSAQIVSPVDTEARCGATLKKEEVLVLDLEPFGEDQAAVESFIAKHAQELVIKSELAETIRTRLKSARKNRMDAMKRAQKVAASRGCNVVLVLQAWAGNNESAYVQALPGGSGVAIGTHYAHARVLMASGQHVGKTP